MALQKGIVAEDASGAANAAKAAENSGIEGDTVAPAMHTQIAAAAEVDDGCGGGAPAVAAADQAEAAAVDAGAELGTERRVERAPEHDGGIAAAAPERAPEHEAAQGLGAELLPVAADGESGGAAAAAAEQADAAMVDADDAGGAAGAAAAVPKKKKRSRQAGRRRRQQKRGKVPTVDGSADGWTAPSGSRTHPSSLEVAPDSDDDL